MWRVQVHVMAGAWNRAVIGSGQLVHDLLGVVCRVDAMFTKDHEGGALDAAPLPPVAARSEVGHVLDNRVDLKPRPQSSCARLESGGPRDRVKAFAAKETVGGSVVGERDRPTRERDADLICDRRFDFRWIGTVG